MFIVSKDTQALYITAVAKDRLPIFQSDAIKKITCAALDEARASCGFLLFAFVIMPDHLHVLTDSPRKPSEVLRYIKGIISHRVIQYLKEKGFESSLAKTATSRTEKKLSILTLAARFECISNLQRKYADAKSKLHSSKSCACRIR